MLGEAAPNFPPSSKPPIQTSRGHGPIQLRNRIVHGYWSIDLQVLHAPALDDLPSFTALLKAVLKDVDL